MTALVFRPFFAAAAAGPRRTPAAAQAAGRTALSEPPLGPGEARRFRELMLPHLDAAYGFARALTRDASAAEDLTQDAFLAAYRGFRGFRGGDPKAWLFAVLRNRFLTATERSRPWGLALPAEDAEALPDPGATPEDRLLRDADDAAVRAAIAALPDPFREAVVLRELQEMSYRDIAEITGVPIGTVMSRLARARRQLAQTLGAEARP